MDYSVKIVNGYRLQGETSQTLGPAEDIETKSKLTKEGHISNINAETRNNFTVASHMFEYRDPQH
jgi:hypothetical protein